MRVEIRRFKNAALITFRTNADKFDSDYERIKFFRGLYGWKQTVPRHNKRYLYHRKGILSDVDHRKVADSVFIVALENLKRIQEYFDQWEEKVAYDIITILANKSIFAEPEEEYA